jgi:hypothetical protein
MFGLLIAACPDFRPAWERFVSDWSEEPETAGEGLPLYLALGDFARHVLGQLGERNAAKLRRVFGAIEQLHLEGDAYVREAATIGLLEALQNLSTREQKQEIFERWLKPESKEWWIRLDKFWDGNANILRE